MFGSMVSKTLHLKFVLSVLKIYFVPMDAFMPRFDF